jgi:hypothetical protein
MVSAEVQRTLVKSPPELWAELSDPTALARHLGGLGDVRIVRTQPETSVEWAAENVSGTVSIKPSGWGTKVTLSVTREASSTTPEDSPVEDARTDNEPAASDNEPAAADNEPAASDNETTAADKAAAADEPTAEEPTIAEEPPAEQPKPRRGFFARLFGRRRKDTPAPRDSAGRIGAFAAISQALAPEAVVTIHAFDLLSAAEAAPPTLTPTPPAPTPAPTPEPEPAVLAAPEPPLEANEPPADISAELLAAEQVAVEEVTAVLTAALDSLGAAHHRPFSRA